MGDLIRFVDRIDAAPTVRLDLNDEASWWVKSFNPAPPRLRRSTAANAMRDGISVGSSTYDSRTLTLELECRKATQDLAATEIQKLWRELDRVDNWLMYQPNGLTKPVFFRTYRSDASQLADVMAQQAMRTFTIEVLAEPFALGLMETLGPYTISNDPAAATNPGYVDISGVLGDVATEAIYTNADARAVTIMGVRHGDFSTIKPTIQAEVATLGTDTANPGGGPDAAMSGTGTNNFIRTSFATTTAMAVRFSSNPYTTFTTQSGEWVIYGIVRRSDATSVMRVGLSSANATTPAETSTIPLSTSRQIIRVGRYSTVAGSNYATKSLSSIDFRIWAERASGAGTIDWDCLFLVPADSAMLEALCYSSTGSLTPDVFDGINDRVSTVVGDPLGFNVDEGQSQVGGRIPQLKPGVTSRLFFITASSYTAAGLRVHSKSVTNAVTIYYWPRYLFVRPVSS